MRGFESFHPSILFLYYVLILVISMFSMNPVILFCAVIGAIVFFGAQTSVRTFFEDVFFYILLFLVFSVMNPLFVHDGETILFFMNDQAITLEAVMYGAMSSLLITGVIIWCRCYSKILTTDKFLYLFGKLVPKLGLVLSMTFRFIPLFRRQIDKISSSQKTMGLYATDAIPDKIRGSIRVFDSLLSWSMENSVDTADAMKARGYGLPGRTNFTLFQFRTMDGIMLAIVMALSAVILVITILGGYTFFYYPYVKTIEMNTKTILMYLPVLLFFLIPGVLEIKERITWKY